MNPELVVRDKEGKIYSVRYDQVNAMLLNEFLKEHRAFVEEQRQVQEQRATIMHLEQQIEALTAGLQEGERTVGIEQVRTENGVERPVAIVAGEYSEIIHTTELRTHENN